MGISPRIVPTAFELDLCTESLITLSLSADALLRATIIGFYTSLLSCYDDINLVGVLCYAHG